MAPPGAHLFKIDLYRENIQNFLVWNQKAQVF